jgi:hypothetical protein
MVLVIVDVCFDSEEVPVGSLGGIRGVGADVIQTDWKPRMLS